MKQVKEEVDGVKFTWDNDAHAGYLYLDENQKSDTVMPLADGIAVDISESGEFLGIEFLSKSALPKKLKEIVDKAKIREK